MPILLVFLLCVLFPPWAMAQSSISEQVLHQSATATGNGATLTVPYFSSVHVQITGSGTWTITFESSQDNSTWTPLRCRNQETAAESTTASASGAWSCAPAGAKYFRARISACTSCTVSAIAGASIAVSRLGGGGSSLTIREQDGSPSVGSVNEIRFPNGTVTDEGGGAVSVASGGGGSSVSINGTAISDPNFVNGNDVTFHTSGMNVTARSKIFLNVRNYGAVCDGTTNDASAIQSAINAAPDGATVVIDGVCGVGAAGLTIASRTNLTIMGINSGGLRLLATPTLTIPSAGIPTMVLVNQSTGVTITGLTITTAVANVDANYISLWQCTKCEVSYVKTTDGGYRTSGVITALAGTDNLFYRNEVNTSSSNAGDNARGLVMGANVTFGSTPGIEINGSIIENICRNTSGTCIVPIFDGGRVQNNTIEMNPALTGSGIAVATATHSPRRMVITGNIISGSAFQGIQIYGATNTDRTGPVIVANNITRETRGSGIYVIRAKNVIVSDNYIENPNRDTTINIGGIYVDHGTDHIVIDGNTIVDTISDSELSSDPSTAMAYGIRLTAAADSSNYGIRISGNMIRNARLNGVNIATSAATSTLRNVTVTDNVVINSVQFPIIVAKTSGSTMEQIVVRNNYIRSLVASYNEVRVTGAPDVAVEGNFVARSTGSGFDSASGSAHILSGATVTLGESAAYVVDNASATTMSTINGGIEGRFTTFYFPNANTTIGTGGNIVTATGSAYNPPANSFVTFVERGTTWYEVGRSQWGNAPTDATYITQTPSGTLSAEQALSTLATGCLGSTTSTGVVASRTITGTTNEISVTNGDCSGNPTIALASTVNLSSKTLRIPNSTTLPATCTTGDAYMDTDATSGQRFYLCESTNTWVLQGDGGGGGGSSAGSSGAVQASNGSGGFVDSGCTASSGVMTCTEYQTSGSGPSIMRFTEGTAPGAPSGAGQHNLYFDSSDSLLKSHENGGSVMTYVTPANTATFTNKTYDAEAAGNVLTIPRRIWFPAAGCVNTTAGSVWDLPTSGAATAACVTGTNTQKGVLDFADDAVNSAQITHKLPSTWTGNIDANIKWFSSVTSGDVEWEISTACVADGETDDPSWNTASTVIDATKGTANQTNDASITSVTVTGCAAGELLHLRILRDAQAGNSDDTLAGTARLIGVELVIREAL